MLDYTSKTLTTRKPTQAGCDELTRWEYDFFDADGDGNPEQSDLGAKAEICAAKLGRDGWEMIAVTRMTFEHRVFYRHWFKRRYITWAADVTVEGKQ